MQDDSQNSGASQAPRAVDGGMGRRAITAGCTVAKKYLILEKIGEGAMGAVYKAGHSWMSRIVALKILHSHLLYSESSLVRFQNEARTASKFAHPNAVTLYDFGIEDGIPYLAMRFAEGQTLKQVLREQGPLTLERVKNIVGQVCGAIIEAHSLGIIHRDLKPENIMVSKSLTGEDWAEVLDFGIAKVTSNLSEEGAPSVTQTGTVIGTPQYMSPEQASGKGIDPRSDLYSMGIIVYEMLCGKVPFSTGSIMEVLLQQINDKPTPLRRANPEIEVPKAVERVVMKALEKEPARRQAGIREFVEDFFAAVAEVEREKSASWRTIYLAGGVLAILAAATVGAYMVRPRQMSSPDSLALLATQSAALGQLSILSTPPGAEVLIDGEDKGVTPLILSDLAPGAYSVTLRAIGYLERSHVLDVSQGMTTSASFPLKPLPPPIIAEGEVLPALVTPPALPTPQLPPSEPEQVAALEKELEKPELSQREPQRPREAAVSEPQKSTAPKSRPLTVVDEAIVIETKPTDLARINRAQQMPADSKDLSSLASLRDLVQQKRAAEAIARLESLVAERRKDVEIKLLLGEAYLQVGKRTQALKQFQDALRLSPGNAEVHYKLATVYSVLRQKEKVVRELQQAIAANPRLRLKVKSDPNFAWVSEFFEE